MLQWAWQSNNLHRMYCSFLLLDVLNVVSLSNVSAQVGDREEGLRSPSECTSSRAGKTCVKNNHGSAFREMFEESLLDFLN